MDDNQTLINKLQHFIINTKVTQSVNISSQDLDAFYVKIYDTIFYSLLFFFYNRQLILNSVVLIYRKTVLTEF